MFYFTATGNSLYVARAFSTEPISIPQALKDGKLEYEADEIGIVFPDFAAAAPLMVREFVEKARLKAPYIFSVITFGNFAANVADWWDDFCKQKGVASQYINTLLMVDNYLPVFDMNEQVKIDKHIPENLAQIVADVEARPEFISHVDADERMQGWLKRLQDQHSRWRPSVCWCSTPRLVLPAALAPRSVRMATSRWATWPSSRVPVNTASPASMPVRRRRSPCTVNVIHRPAIATRMFLWATSSGQTIRINNKEGITQRQAYDDKIFHDAGSGAAECQCLGTE